MLVVVTLRIDDADVALGTLEVGSFLAIGVAITGLQGTIVLER